MALRLVVLYKCATPLPDGSLLPNLSIKVISETTAAAIQQCILGHLQTNGITVKAVQLNDDCGNQVSWADFTALLNSAHKEQSVQPLSSLSPQAVHLPRRVTQQPPHEQPPHEQPPPTQPPDAAANDDAGSRKQHIVTMHYVLLTSTPVIPGGSGRPPALASAVGQRAGASCASAAGPLR